MTEPTSSTPQAAGAAPASKKAAPAASGAGKAPRRGGLVLAFVIVLLLAVALGAAAWYQHRVMGTANRALASQAQDSAEAARQAGEQARQALALGRQQAERLAQMQVSLDEAHEQLQGLEQALQMMTDSGTDIALVNDMDHLVSIAHQQLLLGGNVSNAIIALETAQAQLARANRPALAPLQQAINGDLDRLRAVATVDVNRLSGRLDELGRLIERAPLLVPDDAVPQVDAGAGRRAVAAEPADVRRVDPDASWWRRSLASASNWSRQAWAGLRQDLASFISVRRVDDASALLLSPGQAGRLRDNLRLRLMTAQVALLMHQPDVWRTETEAVVQLLQARYDEKSVDGRHALTLARQLADTSIQVDLPTVANSQQAIQALREANAKAAAQDADPEDGEQPDAPAPDEGHAAAAPAQDTEGAEGGGNAEGGQDTGGAQDAQGGSAPAQPQE